MTNAEKLIQEKYNGIHPICGCGCEEKTVYNHNSKNFGKFKRGHQTRVNPNYFGDPKNPKRVEKIISTRKQKFISGEYNHVKEAIKKNRKDPKLGEKISKGAKGIPKPKPEGFGIGRIHSDITREKMSKTAIENILKTGKVKRSNLEYIFEGVLISLNINYIHSHYIKDIHKIYDFYLPEHNILIEVDGDFWHCNPDSKHALPEYKVQEINIENDKIKSQWAVDNGYKLLRFWENDINNNIQYIKQTLTENIY
jgi:very-short-patch-repair endonuclease